MYDLAIINGKCFINGTWTDDFIYVKDGKIAHIGKDELKAKETFDARGLEVLPGLIDPHVHFELDLGSIVSRDDFEHGSVAALHGGVTTIVDFLEPTANAAALERSFNIRMEQAKKCHVDYHFHATIKQPDGDLEAYVKTMLRLGMKTLKLFTTYSDSGRRTDDETIIALLKLSKRYRFLIMAHIENDAMIKLDPDYSYRDLPKSRPSESELTEAVKLAGFVQTYGGYLYMVHLSSGRTLERLKDEFPDLINRHFFIESCPQYFLFNNQVLNRPDGYLYTCAPPIRSAQEQDLLIQNKRYVDTMATDHCAFNRADKVRERLLGLPLGLGGIEFSFVTMRKIYDDDLIARMSIRVADLMGLDHKGRLSIGQDADISFFNPTPQIAQGHHGRADYCVYEGQSIAGTFVRVLLRGRWALIDGRVTDTHGEPLQGGTIICAKP